MTRYYTDLHPTEPDRSRWTVVHALRAQAGRAPDRTFLITPEEGRTWTYGQILADAERIAGGLRGAGAEAGERVVVMAANSSSFVLTWLGCGLGHLIEVPVNTAYEGVFLSHQAGLVGARWAVIDDVYAERFTALSDELPALEGFWVIDTGRQAEAVAALRAAGWRAEGWDTLLAAGPLQLPEPAARSLASVFFTSGTTGPSKGVAMPHAQMYLFGQEVVALTRLTDRDTYLTVTPLFHGNAQFMAAFPALIAGAALVVRPKFSASRWAAQLRENQVTVTNLIGVMMDFIWKQPPAPDDEDNVLRCVYAAPTASSILEGFMKRFGVEAFLDAFGLTETCAPILSPYGEIRPPGAAGLLAADWFEARLVDPDTDEEVPDGQLGELVVRYKHPWTCSLGYYEMPDQTAQAWRNLWFHTGDALRRDQDGWYYFVDRYKDALRRRGENISSYEVEQAILAHPAVQECAVIGVAAGVEAGEDEVMAVLTTAKPVPPAEIWAWCRGRVPAFAIPRFLRFADALPKTPSEKIRKAELRRAGVTEDTFDRAETTTAPADPAGLDPAEPPMHPYRSLLFVPGNKPDWADKAVKAGADAIVLDLEDSVPDAEKAAARRQVRDSIERLRDAGAGGGVGAGLLVRVNGLATRLTGADLEEMVVPGLDGVFVPKVEHASDVLRYDALLDHFETRNGVTGLQYVIPVETVPAIQNCRAIAQASPRVGAMIGPTAEHADIAREVGFEWTPEGLETLYLRSRVLLACREAGIHPLTALWERLDDRDGLREFAVRGRQLGFRGMVAIHPSHVPVINDVFTPSADEIAFYEGLVAAYEQAALGGSGALRYRGLHIDKAHYDKAVLWLRRARAIGHQDENGER